MNRKQAENLLIDLGKNLEEQDFCEDIYISIKGIGTKTLKSCAYFETETWLFLWTQNESFVVDKRDIGDFVFVPTKETVVSIKKEKTCS